MGEASPKKISYSRDELLVYRDHPLAREWPGFLDRQFTLKDDKHFSAVRWFTEITVDDPLKVSSDRESNGGGGDRDKADGVILGPQRGSFNHGCSGVDSRKKGDRTPVARRNNRKTGERQDHQVSTPGKFKQQHDLLPHWHPQHEDPQQSPQHEQNGSRRQLQPHQSPQAAQQPQRSKRQPQGPLPSAQKSDRDRPRSPVTPKETEGHGQLSQKEQQRSRRQPQGPPGMGQKTDRSKSPVNGKEADSPAQQQQQQNHQQQPPQQSNRNKRQPHGPPSQVQKADRSKSPVPSKRGSDEQAPALRQNQPQQQPQRTGKHAQEPTSPSLKAGNRKAKSPVRGKESEERPSAQSQQVSNGEKLRADKPRAEKSSSEKPSGGKPSGEKPSNGKLSSEKQSLDVHAAVQKLDSPKGSVNVKDIEGQLPTQRLMSAENSFDFDSFLAAVQMKDNGPGSAAMPDDKSRFRQFFTSTTPVRVQSSQPNVTHIEHIPTVAAAPPSVMQAVLGGPVLMHQHTPQNMRQVPPSRLPRNIVSIDPESGRVRRNGLSDVADVEAEAAANAIHALTMHRRPPASQPPALLPTPDETRGPKPSASFNLPSSGFSNEPTTKSSVAAVSGVSVIPVSQRGIAASAPSNMPGTSSQATAASRPTTHVPVGFMPTSVMRKMKVPPSNSSTSMSVRGQQPPPSVGGRTNPLPPSAISNLGPAHVSHLKSVQQAQLQQRYPQPARSKADMPATAMPPIPSSTAEATASSAIGQIAHAEGQSSQAVASVGPPQHGASSQVAGTSLDLTRLHELNQRELQSFVHQHPNYAHPTHQQLYDVQHWNQESGPPPAPGMQHVAAGHMHPQHPHQQPQQHPPPPRVWPQAAPSQPQMRSAGNSNGRAQQGSSEQQARQTANATPSQPLASVHTGTGFRIQLQDLFKMHSSSSDPNPAPSLNSHPGQAAMHSGSQGAHSTNSQPVPQWSQPPQFQPPPPGNPPSGPRQSRVDLSTLFSSFPSRN